MSNICNISSVILLLLRTSSLSIVYSKIEFADRMNFEMQKLHFIILRPSICLSVRPSIIHSADAVAASYTSGGRALSLSVAFSYLSLIHSMANVVVLHIH